MVLDRIVIQLLMIVVIGLLIIILDLIVIRLLIIIRHQSFDSGNEGHIYLRNEWP